MLLINVSTDMLALFAMDATTQPIMSRVVIIVSAVIRMPSHYGLTQAGLSLQVTYGNFSVCTVRWFLLETL